MNILYYSCPYDLSGYGAVSRNHLEGLNKFNDHVVRLKSKKFWSGISPDLGETYNILKEMERNVFKTNEFIFIQHLTPENFYVDPRAKRHIAYTPFETDGVPLAWMLPFRAMDEIWVPSEYNKRAYMNAGISGDSIFVIPHGVDIRKYNPDVKPLNYNKKSFNFGSVFDWTERKNPTALIKAFYNAFNQGEDVSLTLRTFWRFGIGGADYIANEIGRIKQSFVGRSVFPKICLMEDVIDDMFMPRLYRSFDAFVLPSRGEGFGLPYIEAMACGVPTVAPNIGGQTEFMNDRNSFLVQSKLVPISNDLFLRLQPQYQGQNWVDIDEEQLSKAMRWIYDNQDEAKDVAKQGVIDIRDKWKWDNTLDKIRTRIDNISKELS